jgi:hypothetical protein
MTLMRPGKATTRTLRQKLAHQIPPLAKGPKGRKGPKPQKRRAFDVRLEINITAPAFSRVRTFPSAAILLAGWKTCPPLRKQIMSKDAHATSKIGCKDSGQRRAVFPAAIFFRQCDLSDPCVLTPKAADRSGQRIGRRSPEPRPGRSAVIQCCVRSPVRRCVGGSSGVGGGSGAP